MEGTLLDFKPVIDRPDLVPVTTFRAIESWSGPESASDFLVAEINPEYAGGNELCSYYNINPKFGANCLVVEGKRGSNSIIAVCIVPVGYKYDMSGVVRKKLGVRQVSVASLEYVLSISKMEYGSITPIGLPQEWKVFVDPLVLEPERIIIGGGLKKSKLSIPSNALLHLPSVEVLDGLAKNNI